MCIVFKLMHTLILCADLCCMFFFKQKTAYVVRISDWSSDVCSSHLRDARCGELEHFFVDQRAILALEHQAQRAGAGDAEVGRLILVAERVAADDDREIRRASCRERVCQYV